MRLTHEALHDTLGAMIGIVEAREAVPWTKPDAEIPFDGDAMPDMAKPLLPLLGGQFATGFDVLFLDGSVRFLMLLRRSI